MEQQCAIRWLVKCGLTTGAVLVVCGAATAWVGNRLQQPTTTTRDGTLITLNRYVQEPIPDIVLVGSSLTFRLKEEYFTTRSLRNLALAGGSPVTGMEVVVEQPRLPRIILVETNLLSRPPDDAVAARYSRGQNVEQMFLRPIRAAVATYENWIHAPLTHAQFVAAMEHTLKQPPSDFGNRIYVDRALKEFDQDPTQALQANVDRLAGLMQMARQQSVLVMLFEMPYPKEIEATRYAGITRSIVRSRFPDPDRWLRIDVAADELRWLDGVHLDERSAMIVSRSIDQAVGQLLKSH
jgi:hypothetical protein